MNEHDTAEVSDRRARVERAVKQWTAQLIDLTGRNQLLFYKTLKRGTLELSSAESVASELLLAGNSVRLSNLLPATDDEPERFEEALKRSRAVHAKALEHFEERGIDTLYLALGMATWTPLNTKAVPAAPILLRPLRMTPRGAASPDFDLVLDGDWDVNATLLHLLNMQFKVTVDGDELLASLDLDLPSVDPAPLFERFEKEADEVPDFAITHRVVAGTFAYTKLPMVKDLEQSVDELAKHDLIAAIAGDHDAQQTIRDLRARDIDARLPDVTAPSDEFLIVDADASQNYAINTVVNGEPLIIQGPPGTGKSQTIANLITTMAARGKRVLFVAEKRAAIEAVTKRLDASGLGDLVMDLHGGVTSKKQMAEHLGDTLSSLGKTPEPDLAALHDDLAQSRKALVEYEAALHEKHQPWDLSLFDVYRMLLEIPDTVSAPLKFTSDTLVDLTPARVREVLEMIEEWSALSQPILTGRSPWAGAQVTSAEDADQLFDIAVAVAEQHGPKMRDELDRVLAETGLPAPEDVRSWEAVLTVLAEVEATLSTATSEIYELPLEALADKLVPSTQEVWKRLSAQLVDGGYRNAKRTVREVWTGDTKPSAQRLHALVVAAHDQQVRWRGLGGVGHPTAPGGLDSTRADFGELTSKLAALGATLMASDPRNKAHVDVPRAARDLVDDERQLRRLPRIYELEGGLSQAGAGNLIGMVRDGELNPEILGPAFQKSWLTALRRRIESGDSRIREFDGELHRRRVEQFRSADVEHLSSTRARIRRSVAEHAVAARDQHRDQDAIVAAQARRKRGHLTLRQLFEQAPDVLSALRPCWAMSPLVVSQTLPARPLFDVVIFDEASQVLPADAIPALLRAPQAVVAGDRRQLPPTAFFAGSNADDEDDDEFVDDGSSLTTGFESVLDALDPLLGHRMLMWHYRSRDERLISFSNHMIYDSSLTTFPGAYRDGRLQHVLIPHAPGIAVDTRSSDAEVGRVVDLMIDHARERSDETLGVIAMGQYHASRIEAALHKRLIDESDIELNQFFDEGHEERAFVKNLERVQGDERDAIILTIGYGKTSTGQLHYRFGPITNEGGERRLNVAVTRARARMTVVSSFSHTDMQPGRSNARGVELLRQFLKYVESGGLDLDGAGETTPLNAFEIDVKHRLEQAGLRVIPQYGTSGFRIDFAVPHPETSGRFVLAIEADGASYHSSETARDRDRLRQQVLEDKGWQFHRIWSTDWFNNPDAEVKRTLAAYKHSLTNSSATRPTQTSRSEASPAAMATSQQDRIGQSQRHAGATSSTRKGKRPALTPGRSIQEYEARDLVRLARWIRSDGHLRTRDELLQEMMNELDFRRRGTRIVDALNRAIERALAEDGSTS